MYSMNHFCCCPVVRTKSLPAAQRICVHVLRAAGRGAAFARDCLPTGTARHITYGDGGKRASHGAAGQHPYSTSSAPHTALALAVLLHPGAADARVLARVMMPAELLATPQRRCYSILTTPSEAPYTAHQGASYLRTDLPSPSAAAASGPPGTCSIAKPL